MWIYVKYGFVQKLQVVNNTRQILCFLREKNPCFSTFIMMHLTVSSEDEKFRFCVRILCSLLCSSKTNTVSVFSSSELWPGYEKAWEMPPLQSNTKTAWGGKSKAKSVSTYFKDFFPTQRRMWETSLLTKPRKDVATTNKANPEKARCAAVKSDQQTRWSSQSPLLLCSGVVMLSFFNLFFSPSVLSSLQVNLKMHHPFSLFSRHIVSILFFKFWKIVQ